MQPLVPPSLPPAPVCLGRMQPRQNKNAVALHCVPALTPAAAGFGERHCKAKRAAHQGSVLAGRMAVDSLERDGRRDHAQLRTGCNGALWGLVAAGRPARARSTPRVGRGGAPSQHPTTCVRCCVLLPAGLLQVMIKALQMGVEIFLPLALAGCAVCTCSSCRRASSDGRIRRGSCLCCCSHLDKCSPLCCLLLPALLPCCRHMCSAVVPVHYLNRGSDGSAEFTFSRSQLMQLTIAALPRGSHVMWLHFVLCVAYNVWAMYVLSRYFKDFVLVRQHYLSKGARVKA